MLAYAEPDPLRKLFAALTEHAFLAELGLADTKVIDYLSRLLARFANRDAIYAIRGPKGDRLDDLAEMVAEAEQLSHSRDQRREIYRHMGDFALFWSGVYPEAIGLRRRWCRKDALLDYVSYGKRSYYVASTYSDTPSHAEEAPILRRLSEEFELCAQGLRCVRSQWEQVRAEEAEG